MAQKAFDGIMPSEYRSQLQRRVLSLNSIVETSNLTKAVANESSGDIEVLVNFDDVMDTVMSLWYEYQTR